MRVKCLICLVMLPHNAHNIIPSKWDQQYNLNREVASLNSDYYRLFHQRPSCNCLVPRPFPQPVFDHFASFPDHSHAQPVFDHLQYTMILQLPLFPFIMPH